MHNRRHDLSGIEIESEAYLDVFLDRELLLPGLDHVHIGRCLVEASGQLTLGYAAIHAGIFDRIGNGASSRRLLHHRTPLRGFLAGASK